MYPRIRKMRILSHEALGTGGGRDKSDRLFFDEESESEVKIFRKIWWVRMGGGMHSPLCKFFANCEFLDRKKW